jgi:photosystem II stability/assembly factor-like uncharacterized protein
VPIIAGGSKFQNTNFMQPKLGLIFFATLFTGSLGMLKAQPAPTPAADRLKSMEAKKQMASQSPYKTAFRNIGPTVMSGRVVDIEVNPSDPTEFYAAYASGGLWHTSNNGQSFTPIFDREGVITIGDIAVHWPSHTIWVGTGEANSSRSSYSGLGMYKSTNSGETWQWMGLPESHHIGRIIINPSNPDMVWVAVLGHLYTANKERGVYKTADGGKTWHQTLFVDDKTGAVEMEINPSNPNELFACMWYRTRSAWNFEESGKTSGIYKSEDAGDSWKMVSGPGSGLPTTAGFGRSGLAIYPKNPKLIYAVIDNQDHLPDTAQKKIDSGAYAKRDLKGLSKAQFANLDTAKLDSFLRKNQLTPKLSAASIMRKVATDSISSNALYEYLYDANADLFDTPIIGCEVYKSEDGGIHWVRANSKPMPRPYNTYGYYFGKIFVSPVDENKLVITAYTIEMSKDGGKTFKPIGKPNVHADHHACWINPLRDSHMIIGNDGGVNITYDNGDHWFKANTPSVGQFYAITTDNAKPYRVYGGLQDNGVWYGYTSRQRTSDANYDTLAYKSIMGGDGMMVQVDTRDNKTVYSGFQFGNYMRTHTDTGGAKGITPDNILGKPAYRFNWCSPILLSRHNQDILYMGGNKIFRSLDKGMDMEEISTDLTLGGKPGDVPYGTITSISESPLQFGLLYAGTDDGNVQLSKDGGYTWTNISDKIKEVKGLWVSRVLASNYKLGRVYACFNGYRVDHFKPYIYVSDDFGEHWKPIASNLPLEPVNVIVEDHRYDSVLYTGTDGGLYVSSNSGASWNSWHAGLPHSVPIHDITIQKREQEILLGTHGRSIYVASLDPNAKKPVQRRRSEDDDAEGEPE